MPGWQKTKVRLWLDQVGETDGEIIFETIDRCKTDIEARNFLLNRAAKASMPIMVQCSDCEHYAPVGHGGIGTRAVGGPPRGTMAAYPNVSRFCDDFKQEQP